MPAIRVLSILLLLAGGMTFSLIRGQEQDRRDAGPTNTKDRRDAGPTNTTTQAQDRRDAGPTATATATLTRGPARDFSKLDEFPKEMLVSCQRGADWLSRVNGTKGRFLNGYLPALNTPMEGDNYLRQAGAAFALARRRALARRGTLCRARHPGHPYPAR